MTAPVAADVHIALRDGSTARVRPVVPADAPALKTFLSGLSDNSRWDSRRWFRANGSPAPMAAAA